MTTKFANTFRGSKFGWLIAVAGLAAAGCAGHADGGQFQAASSPLRALGIDSYLLTRDDTAAGRYNVAFRNHEAFVGELDQEADGSIRFSLNETRFSASHQDSAMSFQLGAQTGTVTLDASGTPAGDAASLALWEQAKPQLDTIAAIVSELKLEAAAPAETVTAASSCRPNPMYVNGVYLNVFCPVNRVASCQSWLQNNCPFGRVCSNDSHPGDCFRGLEACGGYCNCSSYATGCSVNSDCCSNNCSSNGHARVCH